MTTIRRPAPLLRLALFVVEAAALALGLGVGAARPAAAHDGDAVITVEAAHPAGTGIHYIVRVTWQDDGHPAADATVTATGVGPDGTQLTPVTLPPVDDEGRYAGVVEYPSPGAWTVRITSIDPTGSLEQAQEVTAPPTTAPADGGSEVTTGAGEGQADDEGGGFAAADDGTGDSEAAFEEPQQTDSDGMPVYLVVAAAAVVIIGAVTAVNIIRRNRTDLSGRGDGDRGATAPSGDGASAGDPAASPAGAGAAPDDPTPDA